MRGTFVMVAAGVLVLLVPAARANHSVYSHVSAGGRKGSGPFGITFRGASADGSRVFFETNEQLTSDDTDASADIYERSGGMTALVSKGAVNGNGPFAATFAAASSDGLKIFFTTAEKLTGDDSEAKMDIYQRAGGATTRVSRGAINGNGAVDVIFQRASMDGTRVFFTTSEKLTGDDHDNTVDSYERAGGVTTRVSKGAINGNGAYDAYFTGTSADGSRVFFVTGEKLTNDDADTDGGDVYERSAGTTTLVSIGSLTGTGEEEFGAGFAGNSADGTHVFFVTTEPLTSDDTDTDLDRVDIYERFGGTTTLVSGGFPGGDSGSFQFPMFVGVSADGARVFFQTDERITPDDQDQRLDVYERVGGATLRISQGDPPAGNDNFADAFYRGASTDGTRVFFETPEALTSGDMNGTFDVYEWPAASPASPRDRTRAPASSARPPSEERPPTARTSSSRVRPSSRTPIPIRTTTCTSAPAARRH